MDIALWVAQALLAIAFLGSGFVARQRCRLTVSCSEH